MRPHVNGYCAHENVLQTAHKKNPLRQQVAATGCNLTTYQAQAQASFHANNKWSPNHCYNGVRNLQHAKLQTTTTATPMQQQQHQYQQQHQHAHLQRLNHFHNGYVAQPPLGVAAETMSHNYAKMSAHAVNQQRINECAGIPLISNASTHLAPTHRQRLIRKSSQSPPHIMPHQQSTQHHNSQLMGLRTEAYASWNLPPTVRPHGTTFNNNNVNWQSLTTPFDNRFQTYVAAQQQQQQQQQQHNMNVAKCSGKLEKSRLLRYQNSAPAVLSSIENTNNQPTTNNTTATNEELKTTTTTSETKMMAETCLPRIIKPRKRRKKDRKPTANNNSNNNSNNNNNNNILISEQNMRAMKLNMIDCAAATASTSTSASTSTMLSKQYKSTENIFKQFSHNMLENQAEKYANVNVNGNANANSLLPFYALGAEQLTNKSITTTTTNNTFMPWNFNDENNLRSIWDYPLRRSFSDSSATNSNIKLCNNIWDAKSTASSSSSNSSSSASSSSSSSSSTYSLSSSTADSFFSADLFASENLYPSRAEIVGVIGSNRHVNEQQQNDINIDNNVPRKALLSACLSDSNDSGYGDILTGINIANDLFNHTTTNTTTNKTTSVVNSYNLLTAGSTVSSNLLNAADEAANLLLLPETAETLLNESINEISRKLIETCGNEPMTDFLDMPHSACFSTCSEFSNDSGIETNNNNNNTNTNNKLLNCNELIFNFDNLHMNDNNNNNNNNKSCDMLLGTPSMSKLATTMENFLMHLNDENNNEKIVEEKDEKQQQQHNQQFVKNCLNLVWPNGNEEVREPPITTMLNSMVVELNSTTAFSSH